jgi:hypothetical protein
MASALNKKIGLRILRNGKANRKTSEKSPADVFGILIGKANRLPSTLSERKHLLIKK